MLTIHFNTILTIGLCLLPGSFVAAFLAAWVFQSLELGAMAVAGVVWAVTIVAGLVMTCIGIGMDIH